MAGSFFFYDLETSGFSSSNARIMQFAGQRVSLDLEPIEAPQSYYIKLTEDVLPNPSAVLLTGITPQQTIQEGITEVEFLKLFYEKIYASNTIFVGYNSIRFDDEFMRYLHYRNFYDPYEWHWQNGCSRWDILDLVRMTRALRPDGISWPFDSSGSPSNRLELLTAVNKLDHSKAHDAVSDVEATIALTRLIKNKQTKLFDYLLQMRNKQKVADLVNNNQPFIYTSGKYSSDYGQTTAVVKIADHPKRQQAALVYDLRYDPEPFLKLTKEQLVDSWKWQKESSSPRLPIKTMRFNVCPAVAPLSVLDKASQSRIKINTDEIQAHLKNIQHSKNFVNNVLQALDIMDNQQQTTIYTDQQDVDSRLYDGFIGNQDKNKMSVIRAAEPQDLSSLDITFDDARLNTLLPLYKARNFSKYMSSEEHLQWEQYRKHKLLSGGKDSLVVKYVEELSQLSSKPNLTDKEQYLIQELQLYAESIMPENDDVLLG